MDKTKEDLRTVTSDAEDMPLAGGEGIGIGYEVTLNDM